MSRTSNACLNVELKRIIYNRQLPILQKIEQTNFIFDLSRRTWQEIQYVYVHCVAIGEMDI